MAHVKVDCVHLDGGMRCKLKPGMGRGEGLGNCPIASGRRSLATCTVRKPVSAFEEKQYAIFGGDNAYEPSGGMRDFIGEEDDAKAAIGFAKGYCHDDDCRWAHVWDRRERRIVFDARRTE